MLKHIIISKYKKSFLHRYDKEPYIKYFTYKDFPNLKADSFSFISDNEKLNGNYYYYPNYNKYTLIIFCHGLGPGHLAYMKEIELLCQKGYKVLAYDNYGCDSSNGKSILSISHSLIDLDNLLKFLKESNEFFKYKYVNIIGHSWGGYAASNIVNFHKDLSKIVCISPFISVKNILLSFLDNHKFLFNIINKYESKLYPKYYKSNAISAVSDLDVKFLFIHSENDPVVKYKFNTKILYDNCQNNNVNYLIVKDKKHNPNYTKEAEEYLNSTFIDFNKQIKNKKLQTLEDKKSYFKNINWDEMTKQDQNVWSTIFNFLM